MEERERGEDTLDPMVGTSQTFNAKKGGELGSISLALLLPQFSGFPFPPTLSSFFHLSGVPPTPFFTPSFFPFLVIVFIVTSVL